MTFLQFQLTFLQGWFQIGQKKKDVELTSLLSMGL